MFGWLENLIDPFSPSRAEQPPSSVGGFFRYYLAPLKGILALILVIAGATAVLEMALYVFLADLVDRLAAGDRATFFAEEGRLLAGMAVVVVVLRPISVFLTRGMINLTLVPSLNALVRWDTYRYVLRQSLTYFQNDFAGRIAQKVMQTGVAVRETVVNLIDGVWTLVIYLAGTFYLFADVDPLLVLPILAWTLLYGVVIVVMVPPVRKKSERVSEANSALSGRIVDGYTNIMVVKSFAHAAREDAFARSGFERQLNASRDLLRAIVRMTVTLTVLNGLLIFAVGALSLWLWSTNAASVGGVALALGLSIRLNQMSGWILRTITSLFENLGTVENGIATISRPTKVRDSGDARELVVTEGAIAFDHVRFHYGRTSGIIEDFSLRVRPGERVGLVGRSGAGKSTLVSLLMRFYDLESGRILIDGTDIATVTQESLRASIGLVTQDAALLHRSITDNIRYGRPDATVEMTKAAAHRAHAHDFILDARDPHGRTGYEAHVGERGVKLSGGQRQRVAIARVLLKDAPILLLDEATSALDSEVEAAIQDELETLMEGKTVIAIAHRLSTIARMDRLVVIDAGRIIEMGRHDELLGSRGLYADLWSRQSGGFIAADAAPAPAPYRLDAAQ